MSDRIRCQPHLFFVALMAFSLVPVAKNWAEGNPPPEGEDFFFIPSGFKTEGIPKTAEGPQTTRIRIIARDADTGKTTPCRINVVGPDGNFYHPAENNLSLFSFAGEWPKGKAKGNRRDKAPYRYLGRFFYSTGESIVDVPEGAIRVEVSKGFEFEPRMRTVNVKVGQAETVEFELRRTGAMAPQHYFGGDPHLHLLRTSEANDQTAFNLLDAEDIQYGSLLGYNEPAGPYSGIMDKLDYPQLRGLGLRSIQKRGKIHILSGQEYRSVQYGHLNLYLRDRLVLEGQNINADDWPLYGMIGAETKSQGGYAFHAHGGYALEVYADAALGTVNGVELLQFGIYRGIGLEDWYHILNSGYRFPCVGASDYPACRFLGDCRTYIWADTTPQKPEPDFPSWLQAAADGKSFVTTGPLVLLELDGKRPGETISTTNTPTYSGKASIRVLSEVTPVSRIDLIINGQVAKSFDIPPPVQKGEWYNVEHPITISESSWIAVRAWSTTPGGRPDAESHTNPLYIYLNGRKPFAQKSLDAWVHKIDGQMEKHRQREFSQKSKVLDYFQRARDLLLKIREQKGLGVSDDPVELATAMERSAGQGLVADISKPDVTDEELREFLKPVPATPPAEAVKAFEGVNKFEMQLVAAEPLVTSPIAAAFDEDANLYVCEMRDYPYKPAEGLDPIGRVRLLRDTNKDGVYDEAHVFADNLLWAAGVVPWKGGVFVAAPPDIWYLKDTDGDHRADIKRKVFTGFGTANQQAMVNNLQFGMDHWIYGSTAGNGGTIRPGDQPNAPGVSVNGRDFRFDPITERFETVTGTVQFGNTFDDWGNRFVCSESSPILQIVLPEHYLARNPYLPSPAGVHRIAETPVPIFRISPIERWRQIRSSRRIASYKRSANSAGASHHVVDAAAGVTIYRGGAYPSEFYGQAFVGDGQNNLIHRRALKPDGVPFKSERVDDATEFIRTPDIWFRPVNLVNAPDGTFYCCDMSREVLESIHIPLDVVKHLDLKSGRDNGRIYRIAPPGFQFPAPPQLSDAPSSELVAALESPHGWWRDTASRLLFERQDPSVVARLKQMAVSSDRPQARLLALWALHGLASLDSATILHGLSDDHAGVRENAVRIAESQIKSVPAILQKIVALADDPNPRIRFQVAFSLGETSDPSATAALAKIAHRDGNDQWIQAAILSSVAESADKLFADLIRTATADTPTSILLQLAQVIGVRNRGTEIAATLNAIAESQFASDAGKTDRLILNLGTGLKRAGGHLSLDQTNSKSTPLLSDSIARNERTALDTKATSDARITSISLLSCCPSDSHRALLASLTSVDQPEAIKEAAIRALADDKDSSVSGLILAVLQSLTPDNRRVAFESLISREDGTEALLEAATRGEVSVADLDSTKRELLIGHKNSTIQQLASKLFEKDKSKSRKVVVDEYQVAIKFPGSPIKGQVIFEKNCMNCHQVGGKGYAIGPSLASSPAKEPAALLTHILDPNNYVLPNYLQYVVVDKSGRTFTGLLASQTPTSITLKKERDERITILRGDIEELVSSNKSLMPEGLEKEISPVAMADLIAFLTEAAMQSPENQNATRDFGTLPGLIESSRD